MVTNWVFAINPILTKFGVRGDPTCTFLNFEFRNYFRPQILDQTWDGVTRLIASVVMRRAVPARSIQVHYVIPSDHAHLELLIKK